MHTRILAPWVLVVMVMLGCTPDPTGVAAQSKAIKTTGMSPEAVSELLEKRLKETPTFVPGEVVCKIKPNAPLQPASEAMRRLNLELKPERTSGNEVVYRLAPAALNAMSESATVDRTLAAVKELSTRPEVEYAQPNYLFQIAATPNDTRYAVQWHYFANGTGANQAPGGISLPGTWDVNRGHASVVVAVIDTGILPAHEDIAGSPNLVNGFDMITDPARANDGGGRDGDPTDTGDAVSAGQCFPGSPAQPDSWHGSHVAGTIGVARTNNNLGVAGVNWTTRVQAVRVLGKCGATMVDINDAIRWAAGLPVPGVPNNPTPAKVINMSLGGVSPCSSSPATQSAINDAIARGVTVVVAAGNEAADAAGFLPASCNGVITVAASDRRGHLAQRYSNFGARVDILAPGGDVLRDDDNDGNPDGVLSTVRGGYEFYNGTSMAAPHVAGVAALLIANDPTRTPMQILNGLKSNALPRSTAQCPRACGAGLLSASGIGPAQGGPPPQTVAVTASVNPARIRKGASGVLTATVTRNGAPDSGKTVTFASSDNAVATVTPASAVTDPSGRATATVNGVARGTATLTAQSQGQSATVNVEVPRSGAALPLGFVAVLVLVALAVSGWLRRRTSGA